MTNTYIQDKLVKEYAKLAKIRYDDFVYKTKSGNIIYREIDSEWDGTTISISATVLYSHIENIMTAHKQSLTDYHNHIVEKIIEKIGVDDKGMYRGHLDCPNEGDMYAGIGYREAKDDFVAYMKSLLQDTNK